MKFKQEVNVYFLSPFNIICLEKHYGSGYPFASHFFYTQCWEFELLPASGRKFTNDMQLSQLNSVCVQIKMSFGCQIVKSLLLGNSFVLKESENVVYNTVRNNI